MSDENDVHAVDIVQKGADLDLFAGLIIVVGAVWEGDEVGRFDIELFKGGFFILLMVR